MLLIGRFLFEHFDRRGKLVGRCRAKNGATTAGLNYLLSAGFKGATQSGSWYLSLIGNSPVPVLSASDTSASHAGWAEVTDYSGNRPAFTTASASGGILTNVANKALFTFTGDVVIKGAFCADSNAKGSTSDLIYSTALLNLARAFLSGEALRITYIVKIVGGG